MKITPARLDFFYILAYHYSLPKSKLMSTTLVSDEQCLKHLPQSLQTIAHRLRERPDFTPAFVRKVILEADVTAEDLMPWADFDHPLADSYGRKLVHKDPNFEIMVMSWQPGDFSTIHDHGYTQWGAVQVFGPAEHATFRITDGKLATLARWQMKTGQVVGVNHDLIHQMGNSTDTPFLTLHVYGEPDPVDSVTGDARVFDLENGTIQRVDGGVFFSLPSEDIKRVEAGPKGDFPTRLRHLTELVRRLQKMEIERPQVAAAHREKAIKAMEAPSQQKELLRHLDEILDEAGHHSNSIAWRILNWEMKEAAQLQLELLKEKKKEDKFHKYAELYDALIGQPCLDGFMKGYLQFFSSQYGVDLAQQHIISLGCGTGLVEQHLIDEVGVAKDQIYGIDISESMVDVARKRIHADQGDVLTLDPAIRLWDMAFSGLNVFHYLDFHRLEEAIEKTASILKEGGYFIGDFITPDHIRWYPNVMFSEDKKVVSLRTPCLIEQEGRMFQQSEIINVSFLDDTMDVSYAGKHNRFLPPLHRIRQYFERHFSQVELWDAVSLQSIPEWADSCPSTRYVVVAKK
jgi:SAM-dependent methyltransferase/predicted metal-dependent enzyme (double-stranded beta helix superfamily)